MMIDFNKSPQSLKLIDENSRTFLKFQMISHTQSKEQLINESVGGFSRENED